jgi:nitrite reductase (NADH) small subunit/3-phenylpropionate/trans-cinnamate dioxygenase ferredoxin subunit
MSWIPVSKKGEAAPGTGKMVRAQDKVLALFNLEGEFYCLDNTCAHHGEGEADEDIVTCPWHGWQYNIKTGVSPWDEGARVRSYPVRLEGEEIMVEI